MRRLLLLLLVAVQLISACTAAVTATPADTPPAATFSLAPSSSAARGLLGVFVEPNGTQTNNPLAVNPTAQDIPLDQPPVASCVGSWVAGCRSGRPYTQTHE